MAIPANAAPAADGEQAKQTKQQGPYTGVVIIHGIGDEPRNETLEQALNALTFWFNQVAGLSLRPYGAGRVWVQTELTNDDNPDAKSSCATLELEAPSEVAARFVPEGGKRPLRVEFREVWWARSFGIPPVGASLAWATRQLVEELRILWPSRGQAGLTKAARGAPAREIPQAVTYEPPRESPQAVTYEPAAGTGYAGDEAPSTMSATDRRIRQFLLWIYDGIQAPWKGLQLLVLAPLVLLMILSVQLLRLISFLPIARLASFTGLTNAVTNVSLHWIGPLRVYLLDYTVSAAMRQVFEREVEYFLDDDQCERIVVIAHSMGTVIAYEGLATGLMRPERAGSTKPITFICLAQALRRLWALNGLDQHRLRYVLPERVRWLHFWARYDPVSVGPLNPSILPKSTEWTDREVPNPHPALQSHLERCENVDVVNEDSLFSDHTKYWENLEQVVGPIARELVTGHRALEEVVHNYQARPDDVLRRRMRVATRRMTVMTTGLTVAVLLFVLNQANHWNIGGYLRNLGIVNALFTFLGSAFGLSGILAGISDLLNKSQNNSGQESLLTKFISAVDNFLKENYLDQAANSILEGFLTLTVAVVVLLVLFAFVGRVVAGPPPFEPAFVARMRRRSTHIAFLLCIGLVVLDVIGVVLINTVGDLLAHVNELDPRSVTTAGLFNLGLLLWLGLWGLLNIGIWLASLVLARQRQHWFWFLMILGAAPILGLPFVQFFTSQANQGFGPSLSLWVVVSLAMVIMTWGVFTIVFSEWSRGRILQGIGLLVLLGAVEVTGLIMLPIAPAVLYGIWLGPGAARREAAEHEGGERGDSWRAQRLALYAVVALFVDYAIVAANGNYRDPASGTLVVLVLLGSVLAIAAWIWCLVVIARQKRWVWLVGYLVGSGVAVFLTFFISSVYLFGSLPASFCDANGEQCFISASPAMFFAYGVAPALISMVLVYGIWSLPVRRKGKDKPMDRLMPKPAPVSGGGGAMPPTPSRMPRGGQPWQPAMPQQSQPQPYPPNPAHSPQQPAQPYPPAQGRAPMQPGMAHPQPSAQTGYNLPGETRIGPT